MVIILGFSAFRVVLAGMFYVIKTLLFPSNDTNAIAGNYNCILSSPCIYVVLRHPVLLSMIW